MNSLLSIAYSACLALALLAAFPGSVPAADRAVLRIGGTGSGTVLLDRLTKAFLKKNRDVDVEIVYPVLGSSGGMRALADGRIDVAVIGRKAKPDEHPGQLEIMPYAKTPLVLATSRKKGQAGFSKAQFQTILENGGGTWNDGKRINLVLRQPSESDMRTLESLSPEIQAALGKLIKLPSTVTADTDLDALDLLTRTPDSLGPTTLGLLMLHDSALVPLTLDGVVPNLSTMDSGAYPLAKILYVAFKSGVPSAPVERFIKWLHSAEAVSLLQSAGHRYLPP